MSLKNTTDSYGTLSIVIHWLMAIMIIALLFVGFSMGDMPDGDEKWKIYGLHKATGLLILSLALFRWYWMLSNAKPNPVEGLSKAEIGLSHGTKWILMLAMVVMPVAGIILSLADGHAISFYGLFTIEGFAEKNEPLADFFHEVHEIGAIVIATVIVLHLLAALKHHFIKKDNTLNRMLGRNK